MQPTWVPVYVERAICDLIPDTGYAREIARSAWAWDDEHPDHTNSLYRWQNEAIRQRRDLIALQELIDHENSMYITKTLAAPSTQGKAEMGAISDNRLNQLANDPMMCNITPEVQGALRELIERRKAVSESAAPKGEGGE